MNSQGRVKFQVWALILVVFVLGGVTGASLDRLYLLKGDSARPGMGGPGRFGRGQMLDAMKRDLNLTDEQATKIRNIFEETRKEFHPRRFDECPVFKEMRDKTRANIRQVLTPEQQKRFDEFNQQRDAEMKEDRGR